MTTYNYLESVKEDVRAWIEDNAQYISECCEGYDEEERHEFMYDNMFVSDSVTGNGSGSYFFNTWKAEEAICHNWDLVAEALEEFGCDCSYISKGAEAIDVTIRCYLLRQAIGEVLEEMTEEDED